MRRVALLSVALLTLAGCAPLEPYTGEAAYIVTGECAGIEVVVNYGKLAKRKALCVETNEATVAKELLAEKGYDPQLGARPLRRAIQRMIEDALSEKILYKEFHAGQIIVVDTEEDPDRPGDQKLTFRGVEGFQPPAAVELAATGAPEIEPPVAE
jgi:2,3-bisphosphoglycerate-independent phosphoglycerate mutase